MYHSKLLGYGLATVVDLWSDTSLLIHQQLRSESFDLYSIKIALTGIIYSYIVPLLFGIESLGIHGQMQSNKGLLKWREVEGHRVEMWI